MKRTANGTGTAIIGMVALVILAGGCGNDATTPTGPSATTPPPPTQTLSASLSYVGSDACGFCHTNTFNEVMKSGHPYKLNKVENGQPPTYPFSAVPNPPAGFTWNDITYVIGGFGWKARFLGKDGFIITQGGMNQYNLATGQWVDYHKDEVKPYDCGRCHTTGFSAEGHQDALPGIEGTWAEPGIGCEACHGPGSLHVENPEKVRMTVDTRSESCGACHNRGGTNSTIIAKGGFIMHHEQFNEIQSSAMGQLECVTCHDPHTGTKYNDQEGAVAIVSDCESCHTKARASIVNGVLGAQMGSVACEDCHMPHESKSAVKNGPFDGDIRTHIFTINTDSLAAPFTTDGGQANPYLTVDFACLSCHTDDNEGWASRNAADVHGANFADVRIKATVRRH